MKHPLFIIHWINLSIVVVHFRSQSKLLSCRRHNFCFNHNNNNNKTFKENISNTILLTWLRHTCVFEHLHLRESYVCQRALSKMLHLSFILSKCCPSVFFTFISCVCVFLFLFSNIYYSLFHFYLCYMLIRDTHIYIVLRVFWWFFVVVQRHLFRNLYRVHARMIIKWYLSGKNTFVNTHS